MARNNPNGRGRLGAIRGRTQFKLPSGHYAKRDRQTGEILSVKADFKPYKGIVIEKHPPTTVPPVRADRSRRPRRQVLPTLPTRTRLLPLLTPPPAR